MTLYELMQECGNFFEVTVFEDDYTISGGTIVLPQMQSGQYFLIRGSVFNDGLYTYPPDPFNLVDEAFHGTVTALAVPKAFLQLAEEITAWDAANGAGTLSPYKSESFGGYSYTRSDSSSGGAYGWRDVFKARLRPWRKL